MRLINTHTLQLEQFTGLIPHNKAYAILSHTWGDDEVLFEDMKDLAVARTKQGFLKIENTCELARQTGLSYAWVDTCCIDKSSSAELSEAINSMFRWYKDAYICFAILADVPTSTSPLTMEDLKVCKWFTRGWTLQELIAPFDLVFFDREWEARGSRRDSAETIEALTGIDNLLLTQPDLGSMEVLSKVALARRMSWASRRETTRIEDQAYCLLGIFDVNMPMLYGEGAKSFIRLQEEILKRTTDLSLFAWQEPRHIKANFPKVLSTSPTNFQACADMYLYNDQFTFRDEIATTNRGIRIHTSLQRIGSTLFLLDLGIYRRQTRAEQEWEQERIGILLKRVMDTYYRYDPRRIAVVENEEMGALRPLYLASFGTRDPVGTVITEDSSIRLHIFFPEVSYVGTSSDLYKIENIKAVPEAFWRAGDDYFFDWPVSFEFFTCFVRFCVTPVSEKPGVGTTETTEFMVVCAVTRTSFENVYLCTGDDMHEKNWLDEFIDPFKSPEAYGSQGHRFSLDQLRAHKSGLTVHTGHGVATGGRYAVTATPFVENSSFRVHIDVKPTTKPRLRKKKRLFAIFQDYPSRASLTATAW